MHEILQTVFRDNAIGRTQTFKQFSHFKCMETLVKDCQHSGYPSTRHTDKTMKKAQKTVNTDQSCTIMEMAGRLGLTYGIHQKILRRGLTFRYVQNICLSCVIHKQN